MKPAPGQVLVLLALSLSHGRALGLDHGPLLETLERAPSYEARMKAARSLLAHLESPAELAAMPEDVLDRLARVAKNDDHHIVRGMACFAMGKLRDERALPHLQAALSDPHAFVRDQADLALTFLRMTAPARNVAAIAATSTTPEPLSATPSPETIPARRAMQSEAPELVVGVTRTPGVEVPEALFEALRAELEQSLAKKVSGRFTIGSDPGRAGYFLEGTLSEVGVTDAGGEQRVSLVLKIAISTWPEKNLRHVVSARASASTKKSENAVRTLSLALLRAAVERGADDALLEIDPRRRK